MNLAQIIEAIDLETTKSKKLKLKKIYLKMVEEEALVTEKFIDVLKMDLNRWDIKQVEAVRQKMSLLADIINASNEILLDVNEDVNYKHMHRKKELLIKSAALSSHYLTSIYELLATFNTTAAKVLVRSILEIEQNASYIYLTKSNENLNKLIVSEIMMGIKAVKNHRALETKQSRINEADRTIVKLQKRVTKYGGKDAPSIFTRAKIIDEANDAQYTQLAYLYWYSLYSDDVHGSTYALDQLPDGLNILFIGNLEDYPKIIDLATSYHTYLLEKLVVRVYSSSQKSKILYKLLEEYDV